MRTGLVQIGFRRRRAIHPSPVWPRASQVDSLFPAHSLANCSVFTTKEKSVLLTRPSTNAGSASPMSVPERKVLKWCVLRERQPPRKRSIAFFLSPRARSEVPLVSTQLYQ
jgi:hypothetical protein